MIFNLVRIIIDVVHLTTVGLCVDVEQHLPWTINPEALVFMYQEDGLCNINYRALDIPAWATQWSVRNQYQNYWGESTVVLRSISPE